MRLLAIGSLDGHMDEACMMAFQNGAKVTNVANIDDAIIKLRGGNGADIILIDVRMDVGRLVNQLKTERFVLPVIACGIDGTSAQMAEQSIHDGAQEYLPLPPQADMIAAIIESVAKPNKTVIYNDPKTKDVFDLALRVAPSDASVLITGESGTGKEVMAHFIHENSKRAKGAFVAINCAAIPENLLESELFGHEKGAFTGALARRIGKFEEANGGTILLDEISEMDPRLQAKLLRVLQEREIDRVGGTKPVTCDVRVLATSNRNMKDAVQKQTFREDLFFRLNVFDIQMPSLRERPKDIPALSVFFAKKYASANGLITPNIDEEAIAKLTAHHFSGNVRELENTIHRAVLLAQNDKITAHEVIFSDAPSPQEKQQHLQSQSFQGRSLSQIERQAIIATIDECMGDPNDAAHILGISVRLLRNKLNQYDQEGYDIPALQE